MSLPFVVCLCPTYRRPDLLENAIACFERQDYPADRRFLMAVDDAFELPQTMRPDWLLVSVATRYRSLCEKYNAIVRDFSPHQSEILMVWEDDDVYLPGHISKHVEAYMRSGSIGKPAWCKPPYAWTTHPHEYTNLPYTEQTSGRFHASISLTRQMFDAVGGWPNTKELNFDQQFMASLEKIAPPLQTTHPWTYVFRWADTGAYHGQAYGDDWWDRIPHETTPQPRDSIVPRLDASAAMLMDFCTKGRG